MKFISTPFASFLALLTDAFNSYGWAILAFGLVVKIVLLPFQMKSKHAMMRTTMLQPRVKELERKYATDKQKFQEEVSKLYKEAKANPMSGCLWTLIPFPILIALYTVVRQPLSKLMGLAAEQISTLTDLASTLGVYTVPARADAYAEMRIANVLSEHFNDFITNPAVAEFADKLKNINFHFFGLNISNQPRLLFWNYFEEYGKVAAILLFLVPIVSGGLSYLQSKISQAMQPAPDPKDPNAAKSAQTAQSMMFMMPLMSVYICFIMPAAMGIYWIEQSILAIIQEAILNRYYKGRLDKEMAEFNAIQKAKEEELERKRQETERLKAEGKMQQNVNTSKKRIAAKEKNDAAQRAAAQRAAERAAKGLEKELPDSQVGNRRYARGRAYVADRFVVSAEEVAAEEAAIAAVEAAEEAAAEEAVIAAEETAAEETAAEEAAVEESAAAETPAAENTEE